MTRFGLFLCAWWLVTIAFAFSFLNFTWLKFVAGLHVDVGMALRVDMIAVILTSFGYLFFVIVKSLFAGKGSRPHQAAIAAQFPKRASYGPELFFLSRRLLCRSPTHAQLFVPFAAPLCSLCFPHTESPRSAAPFSLESGPPALQHGECPLLIRTHPAFSNRSTIPVPTRARDHRHRRRSRLHYDEFSSKFRQTGGLGARRKVWYIAATKRTMGAAVSVLGHSFKSNGCDLI